MQTDRRSKIIIVSASGRTRESLTDWILDGRYAEISGASSGAEARRFAAQRDLDLAVIAPPIAGDLEMELAEDLSARGIAVMLLAEPMQCDLLSGICEEAGIALLRMPVSRDGFSQALGLLLAMQRRLSETQAQLRKLQRRLDDERFINRAKLMLALERGMSESEAHRYLEKQAMDRCIKLRQAAELALRGEI